MRAVNLIPTDQRRGPQRASRAGFASYTVVGGLLLALAGITFMVLLSNQVQDREAEVHALKDKDTALQGDVDKLASFTSFDSFHDARVATVSSLADSRFNWERVMRELSLTMPDDIWLIKLTATVRPDVQVEDSLEIPQRDSAAGPALELMGCAPNQEAIAGFIARLYDIDGVTRVALAKSQMPALQQDMTFDDAEDDDCRTRDFISKFEIVVAFDAAPVPPVMSADPSAVPTTVPAGTGTTAESATSDTAAGTEG